MAERFTSVASVVVDWSAPTPVDGWVARDVVAHLVEWFPAFLLRSSGHYGPRVPVPDDADPETRLVGFIGRDPHWAP